MGTVTINRARPEVHEDNVGMMSTPISMDSWGNVEDGPYAGYAEGVSLGMEVPTNLSEVLGVPECEFGQEVYDAITEVLKEYPGVEWTNDSAEYLSVEFGVAYEDNETDDEMVDRILRETGFIKLYNEGILFLHFTERLAAKLGRRRYINDVEGDGWVSADDTTTPDVYSRNGERHVVMPRPR